MCENITPNCLQNSEKNMNCLESVLMYAPLPWIYLLPLQQDLWLCKLVFCEMEIKCNPEKDIGTRSGVVFYSLNVRINKVSSVLHGIKFTPKTVTKSLTSCFSRQSQNIILTILISSPPWIMNLVFFTEMHPISVMWVLQNI